MFEDETLVEKKQSTVRGMSCGCGGVLVAIGNKTIRTNFAEMTVDSRHEGSEEATVVWHLKEGCFRKRNVRCQKT